MSTTGETRIRPARRADAETIFGLIVELAEYEKLRDQVVGDAELLEETLFDRGVAEALIAEEGDEAIGYAIYFDTFSSFECRPGIWLEDLYVRPERRRSGIGRAVLERVAAIALERGCARLEWVALDWNTPALSFYDGLGAARVEGWETLRLEGEPLRRLGSGA